MRKLMTLALFAGALIASGAHSADFGVYGTMGTVGPGGGLAASFGSHAGVRLGYTGFTYDVDDYESSDLLFDGSTEIGGLQALLDIHPFGGGFRLSVGVLENAAVDATAVPVGDTFEFNGVTYSAADVGTARGTARFDSYSPYVGLGFGHALSRDGRFAFNADVGVVFTGSPTVKLEATCTAAAASLCTDLEDDVAAEQAELQEDADDFSYWPVLSLGVSYKF